LVGEGVRIPEVGTVHDQGVELGPKADPKTVVFVLLRAIRDDVLAGQDRAARRSALERQLAVSDPDYIDEWYRREYGPMAVATREEWVEQKVRLWAPTLAYYVSAFDFDLDAARGRMTVGKNQGENWPGETCHIDLPVADPTGQPDAAVVVRVRLHQNAGGYWRVFQAGFARERSVRVRQAPATSQPATQPSPPKPRDTATQPS